MKKFSLLVFITFSLSFNIFSQIHIKEISSKLPQSLIKYTGNENRNIVDFNSNWSVKKELSGDASSEISVPASFTSENSLVFEKNFELPHNSDNSRSYTINFLGISYSAEIYLNDIVIYKKPAGNVPFSVLLPNDLLNVNSENKLTLVVVNDLDSKTTIPFFQRFLFPKDAGGILRDVYLESIPIQHFSVVEKSLLLNSQLNSAEIKYLFEFNNLTANDSYKVNIKLVDDKGFEVIKRIFNIDYLQNQKLLSFSFKRPKLWSPITPTVYNEIITLTRNDSIVDSSTKTIQFSKFENRPDGIILNGKKFIPKGVTYISSSLKNGVLKSFDEIKKELLLIKNLGVNSVRFAKSTPHPYALDICNEIGLIAFIEIPINSLPSSFTDNETYPNRVKNFLSDFVLVYSKYPAVFAIGVGGGYLSNNDKLLNFANNLGKIIHTKSNKLSYASFNGIPSKELSDIDLYGVELFGETKPLDKYLLTTSLNRNKVFISEATYPKYYGSTNGYLNKFSLESQAKFFENIIDESNSKNIAGFFLNSMFDYYGDFSSPFAKFNSDNKYSIGIVGDKGNSNTLSFKVINSKLITGKRITIPLGSKSDDAPIFFILSGLFLALLMGILINSNKKFREDATRALLRPYNFYADIRDHRIISGFSTIILLVILSGAHALLLTNILYYFKNSVTFEKILLSFGTPSIISTFNYLAWNPVPAFFYILIFGILFIIFLSWLAYVASFPLKMKIYFRNVFFTIVWAVLPLSILIPVKMVLYRILEANAINIYIYAFLAIYFLWIAQRIIKGIYVIFDISLSQAYFYSLVAIAFVLGIIVLYFQLSYSTLDFLLQAIYQSQLI